jgi:2-polyprenyl-6-hydroxyphenyl methylase/3-demethylubiquinone-9 3-methyltransferase
MARPLPLLRRYALHSGAGRPLRQHSTVSDAEVKHLSHTVDEWWDPRGPFSALHRYNPTRVKFIRDEVCKAKPLDAQRLRPFEGLEVLDVGCGGGILAEALSRLGGSVTGLDASAQNVEAATARRARQPQLRDLTYAHTTAEALVAEGRSYDVVVASEVLEHVADAPLFLACLADLTKAGGVVIVTTFNKTFLSWALGVVVAEHLLGVAEKGTHDWAKFMAPDDVTAILTRHGLQAGTVTGVAVLPDPLAGGLRFLPSPLTAVNYMLSARRPAAASPSAT